MASKKQRIDAAKQRDKRSKIALVVLLVLFLGVAAFEIPSMLEMMNKKPLAPAVATRPQGPPSVAPGLPNIAAGASVASANQTPKGQLVDTDVPPATGTGQLMSFEDFQTKNPFTPQVTNAGAAGSATSPASSPSATPTGLNHQPISTTSSTTSINATPNSAVPSAGGSAGTPTGTTPTSTPSPPPVPAVTIAVNGVASRVGVAGTFPAGAPVFRLVSFRTGTAQVGIVGGSYASGGGSLTLQVGHLVTLENTVDGKRYQLELLKTP